MPAPYRIPSASIFLIVFLKLTFDTNEFCRFIYAIFIFYCSDSRKFGHSTFELSLVFEFEMLTILKFYCLTF